MLPTKEPEAAVIKLLSIAVIRGTACSAKGELVEAVSDFTKAIEIYPKYANAFYNRGIAHAMKGERDLSTPDYAKAIALDPRLAHRPKR
jgi:tetratricopeptide (TPR) repeat protein